MKFKPGIYALVVTLVLSVLAFSSHSLSKGEEFSAIYKDLPFEMPQVKLPVIPRNDFYITDFGALGDGLTDNTRAINKAIVHMSKKGGGRLIFPRGVWLSGPIELKSKLELHLQAGALIKFIPRKELYPLIATSYEGYNAWRPISPIFGKNLSDIAITGSGVIDGSGGSWRYVKKSKMTTKQWENLLKTGVTSDDGKLWFPSEESKRGYLEQKQNDIFKYEKDQAQKIHHWLRPVMVALIESERILLDGPTFQNSPAWNIHLLMSRHVVVRNLKVRNPWYSQNGDGLDLESVKNVLVYNNTFDVGDDAICVKSGKNEDGRQRGIPSENIVIRNNMVYHAHGGFVVGSEMSGGVKNVFFADATFIGTDIGIRFKSTRGRGGVVEKIWVANVDMTDIVKNAIGFNMFYSNNEPRLANRLNKKALPPVDETTPLFKDISIENLRVVNAGRAVLLQGLPEHKLANVNISKSYFKSKEGFELVDTKGFKVSDVTLDTKAKEAIILMNSSEASISKLKLLSSNTVRVLGSNTKDIQLDKEIFKNYSIVIEKEVDKTAVKPIAH